MPTQPHYDMIIIGSGPSGQRAAVQAAKLGKKVLIVERDWIGGSCLSTGTIPSKTLREAALEFSPEHPTHFDDIMKRKHWVIEEETKVISEQLERNKIEFKQGKASFVSPHSVRVESATGTVEVKGTFLVVATGT